MAEDERTARYARLVLPHLGSAYRLARWLTRSHEDAEEVVQEACLSAFRAFDGLRGDTEAHGWLLAIVRHAAYAQLRRRHAQPGFEVFDETVHDGIDESGLADAWPTAVDPVTLLLRREDAARVNQAVTALPVVFREVLVLREFEGLSYREIAAMIGVPQGTVMSRLARARQQLWVRLAGTDGRDD
jgi:RNA polymerase sigma-70 factor, ECF subfamily